MKYLKQLLFDKNVVSDLRDVDANFLYNQLFIGRITLQEYLEATKKA